MDSILNTIKKLLGIDPDYDPFDTDIIVGINSALMTLTQVGVGPRKGFSIRDSTETWEDFIGDRNDLEAIKTYVYLKTKLIFDPPTNSFTIDAIERQAEEYLWRINVNAERREDICRRTNCIISDEKE